MMTSAAEIINTEQFGKVAVLMGGWSAERTISLQSGQAVLDALIRQNIDAFGIDVNKHTLFKQLTTHDIDRVFIALHGKGGEDGVIQSVLEVLEIPYTGSGVLASALAMDKLRSKQIFEGVSLPIPGYMIMDEKTDPQSVIAQLGLPLIVKPTLEGSSLGMSKVETEDTLQQAYVTAQPYAGDVLVEQWITGKEYTVSIVGDDALPVIWLETPHSFYDYSAKYQAGDTQYHCPCGLSEEEEGRLQRLALAAFNLLGTKGWGRVDLMCDETGKAWIIEVNTVPGMTDHSLVPMAAKGNGWSFDELVVAILTTTLIQEQSVTTEGYASV